MSAVPPRWQPQPQKLKGRNPENPGRAGFRRSGRGRFKKSTQRTSSGIGKSDVQTKYPKKKSTGSKSGGSYSNGVSSRNTTGNGHAFGSGIGMMPI